MVRRPKFEIVSFDKASTPLLQLDIQMNTSYEILLGLFPEALVYPLIRNLWIYLENPYGLDICLVVNELKFGAIYGIEVIIYLFSTLFCSCLGNCRLFGNFWGGSAYMGV